tara:strand:- start:367 stop:567 length:201 start_codon:yes stop_codon:yes gene_type:complete
LRIATALLGTFASIFVTTAHIAHTGITGARCGGYGTFARTDTEQGTEVQRPSDYSTNKEAEPVVFD